MALAWDTLTCVGSTADAFAMSVPKAWRLGNGAVAVAGLSVYATILNGAAEHYRNVKFDSNKTVYEFFVRFWRDLREHHTFVNDQHESDDITPFADLGAEFIVATPTKMFRVKEVLSVTEFSPHLAIGSGAPHAEGALAALYTDSGSAAAIARRAVEIAAVYDRRTGSSVEVMDLGR